MTHAQFIEEIGAAVQRLAPEYGIRVCSPIIAQAILESAWGASNKALFKNYFGLKYRPGRVTCHSGTFADGSSEQLKDGMRAVKTMAQSALAVCRRLTNERVFLDPLFIETLDKNFIELACFVEC